MFSRFLPAVCSKYNQNRIVVLVNKCLKWIFSQTFQLPNLVIVDEDELHTMPQFHYHCSMMYLMKVLDVSYETVPRYSYQLTIRPPRTKHNKEALELISSKPTFLFNWKGNLQNPHELHNRQMPLVEAIPLFKLDVNWIVIKQNITDQELKLLKQYKVYIYDTIDNESGNAFYSSMAIIKNVRGVITTDTSVAHLALSLQTPTMVMLTAGCEWRWTRDERTNWYPTATLIRQDTQGNWTNVVNQCCEHILKS
jgi:hypothetical protein